MGKGSDPPDLNCPLPAHRCWVVVGFLFVCFKMLGDAIMSLLNPFWFDCQHPIDLHLDCHCFKFSTVRAFIHFNKSIFKLL